MNIKPHSIPLEGEQEPFEKEEQQRYYTLAIRWNYGWQPLWQGRKHDPRNEDSERFLIEAHKHADNQYTAAHDKILEIRITEHLVTRTESAKTIPLMWEVTE